MSALETYLTQARQLKGLEHQNAIRALRTYLRLTSEDDIRLAIERITDIYLLKYLIEAGLNARLQKITLLRYDLLKKEKGGGT